jgi:hypothetical protein
MSVRYFFDIPIYRCPIEKHTTEMDKEKQRLLNLGLQGWGELLESYASRLEAFFDSSLWYPWRFNEIVGWVRLYALGSQIRGEWWFVKARRIRKSKKKKLVYHSGKAFEHHFDPDTSRNDIYEAVCSELEQLCSEKPFRNRYMDLETFHNAGPFINWRQLISFD